MSATSIFSGPAGPQCIGAGVHGTDSPKGHENTARAIVLSFAEKTDQETDAVEYKFRERNGPARLIDILYLYPALEVVASELEHQDLLALALVNKEIHQILGQSTSKEYWKHLWGKCMPLKCELPPSSSGNTRPCTEAVRCIKCRKGFCFYRTGMWDMLDGAERRIRRVCRDCILMGRNPLLTDPNLFPEHTLNQLIEGRKWMPNGVHRNTIPQVEYTELQEIQQKAQQRDITFCPNQSKLFDLQRTPRINHWDTSSEDPVVAWQTVLRPSTYDPIFDRIRQHQSSRCMCIQAGFAVPLCDTCAQVGSYADWGYHAFNRQNPDTCECGTLLGDLVDENGTVVHIGHRWDPKKHSLSLSKTAINSNEGETIIGLCSWCGFLVYEQAEKGKLPETEAEWQEYLAKRHKEISVYGGSTSSGSAEDIQMK